MVTLSSLVPVDLWWPGLVFLGFMIGIITGFFGVGGGFLLTPSLRVVFNIPYPIAIGSSLLQILMTSFFSTYRQCRQRNLDFKLGAVTALGSLIGAECGVRLLSSISTKGTIDIGTYSVQTLDIVLNSCFFVLMLTVSVFMYREASKSNANIEDEPEIGLKKCILKCSLPPFLSFERSNIESLSFWVPFSLSFIVGCLTGLLGIGGGFISLPIMIYLLGVPTRIAVGTSTMQVMLASGYGMLRHMQDGNVDVRLVAFMFVGSLAGVNTGVRLAKRVNVRDTRKYFAGLLLVGVLLILYDVIKRFNY